VGVRDLPDGWSWDGTTLVWTSDAPIIIGGGRPEFRLDGVVVGYPREEGTTLRLEGAVDLMPSTGELSVWRSGRRLDAAVAPTPAPDVDLGPAPRISPLDPAARGRFEIARRSYRLEPLPIQPYPQPVEMVGEVTSPVGSSAPMPLVLVLHGRHSTCFTTGGEISGDWPCPAGWRSVPSHQGYRDTADALASQGYIVVSISANAINAQDSFDFDGGASVRSQLVRAHLTQWATWNTSDTDPWGGRFEGRIDLSRVVLVGHSRGGEGVARAAIDTRRSDPWAVRGLVLLAPTAFARLAAPQADTVVVLPACDGDVYDLQGQQYLDVARDALSDGALRSTVFVPGANHNFFNTEWTPGISRAPSVDDGDFACVPESRLSARAQRAVGRAYTAALVRLVTRGDDATLALLDGRGVAPAGIGDVAVSVTAIGGAARLLVRADETAGSSIGPIRSRRCVGQVVGVGRTAIPDLCYPLTPKASPHWLIAEGGTLMPPGGGTRLDWTRAGGAARFRLRSDLSRTDSIDLRVVVPRSDTTVELAVRVRDADGDVAVLGERRVRAQRHGWLLARHVRVPLRDVPRRIDLARIRSVEVVARSAEGTAVILDIWARRRALPQIDETPIPVISVQSRRVVEGSTRRTIEMSLDVRGEITRPARVWVQVITPSVEMTGRLIVLRPGAEPPTIVVPIEGNTLYDGGPRSTTVAAFALDDAVVARSYGGADVTEDDAAPTLTIAPLDATAAEGSDLAWTLRLSEPVSFYVGWGLECRNGTPDPIASTDVTSESIGIVADPAVLLCDAMPPWFIGIEPGETEATLTIGTLADGVAEPAETATFVLSSFPGDPITPDPVEMTATIEASP
jgi:dienelactone hydrolase